MDNLTHSLIGIAAAEISLEWRSKKRPETSPRLRRFLWGASILGNNFPDLDFLYTDMVSGVDLGYLLHHRGYTHTFLFGPLLGLLVFGILYAASWRQTQKSAHKFRRNDWLLLLGLSILGPFLHIAADSWNNYGVHPLWPFNKKWFYGDAVFILEPYIWTAFLIALLFRTKGWIRTVFGIFLGIGLVIPWLVSFVPWMTAVDLLANAVLLSGIYYFMHFIQKARWLMTAAAGFAALFIATSFGIRAYVDRQVRSTIQKSFPESQIDEIVLTPMPINRVCWRLITIETTGSPPTYIMRRGMFSIFPNLLPAEMCPSLYTNAGIPAVSPVPIANTKSITWSGQFEAPLFELKALSSQYCGVRAFLTTARAPYWVVNGDSIFIGDLRYSGFQPAPRANFFVLTDVNICPPQIPTWTPPRHRLLTKAVAD